MQMERRLVAILSADVAGYARLIGMDESGTLAALRAHQSELFNPKSAQHKGRTIKLMGDGALMEFASVVDAVLFAVDVQCAMRNRNVDVPEDRRIVFRVGINVGDVIIEGDDIHGDGVNVAARLEALAEPGSICLSRSVHDQVRDKLDLDFEDLGEIEVKNITRSLRVFRILLNERAMALTTPVRSPSSVGAARRLRPWPVATIFAFFLSIAGLIWWHPWVSNIEPASLDQMAFPLPDKPSIAVLPFDNLTGDPNQEHVADGMTETLISTLSRIPELFVIARNSSSTYKGKAVKVQTVAEELGVQYLLEGSVQQAGERIRIIVQLIDALEGHHVWTETYDRKFEDLFGLQDEIALKIAIELQVKLTTGVEARMLSRTTNNVRAWALYQQALSNFFKFDSESTHEARRFAEKALDEDPTFADAMVIVGFTHLVDARSGYTTAPQESLSLAIEYVEKARSIAPDAPNLYNLIQSIHRYQGEFDKAIAAGRRAIELSPNSEISLLATAMTTNLAGEFAQSIELAQKAVRQNPHHRSIALIWLGRSLWFKRDYSEAMDAAMDGLERAESPLIASAHMLNLAAIYYETGEIDMARNAVNDALQKAPQYNLSRLKSINGYRNDADWQRFSSALRSAGLPE
jgi:TolB-like protein/class 3 adenylate cyclase/Flp pilus assembly protein TadD